MTCHAKLANLQQPTAVAAEEVVAATTPAEAVVPAAAPCGATTVYSYTHVQAMIFRSSTRKLHTKHYRRGLSRVGEELQTDTGYMERVQ